LISQPVISSSIELNLLWKPGERQVNFGERAAPFRAIGGILQRNILL
jgi:hypothetical protein